MQRLLRENVEVALQAGHTPRITPCNPLTTKKVMTVGEELEKLRYDERVSDLAWGLACLEQALWQEAREYMRADDDGMAPEPVPSY